MNPATIKAEIKVDENRQEILIAALAELGFSGFEQGTDHLFAYISARDFSDRLKSYLSDLKSLYPGVSLIGIEEIADRNWNAIWEATVKPQQIGTFYIRPSWAIGDLPDKVTIVIDPKMAFGTGYHETTRLMLEKLSDMEIGGKQVLDAGTGTGILAIAAVKRGADYVFAFDTDIWSKVNASENIRINGVDDKTEVAAGGSSVIPVEEKYDVILANINRNALIKLLPDFVFHLKTEGELCLSGLQAVDKQAMLSVTEQYSLILTDESQSGEWLLLCFRFAGENSRS